MASTEFDEIASFEYPSTLVAEDWKNFRGLFSMSSDIDKELAKLQKEAEALDDKLDDFQKRREQKEKPVREALAKTGTMKKPDMTGLKSLLTDLQGIVTYKSGKLPPLIKSTLAAIAKAASQDKDKQKLQQRLKEMSTAATAYATRVDSVLKGIEQEIKKLSADVDNRVKAEEKAAEIEELMGLLKERYDEHVKGVNALKRVFPEAQRHVATHEARIRDLAEKLPGDGSHETNLAAWKEEQLKNARGEVFLVIDALELKPVEIPDYDANLGGHMGDLPCSEETLAVIQRVEEATEALRKVPPIAKYLTMVDIPTIATPDALKKLPKEVSRAKIDALTQSANAYRSAAEEQKRIQAEVAKLAVHRTALPKVIEAAVTKAQEVRKTFLETRIKNTVARVATLRNEWAVHRTAIDGLTGFFESRIVPQGGLSPSFDELQTALTAVDRAHTAKPPVAPSQGDAERLKQALAKTDEILGQYAQALDAYMKTKGSAAPPAAMVGRGWLKARQADLALISASYFPAPRRA